MPKYTFKPLLIASFLFCSVSVLYSQTEEIRHYNNQRIKTSNQAMYILGGWAIGNIALGGIMRGRTEGQTRYFHEMNVFWNLVNLGIAGASLYGNSQLDPGSLSLYESLAAQNKLEKILWFNVALNGSYILGGAWLKERAKSAINKPERLKGYGNAVILQGSFLLAYDLVHVLIQQSQSSDKLDSFLSHIQPTQQGFLLTFIF